ncbi:MAG TPA: hypothetical protein PKZ53_12650, partial [Acidobacteriota bacterium]|nr:hypothetical protein [Acidobacteriota bacterium]
MTAFRCMLGVWFVLGLGLSVQAAEPTIQVNEAGSKATTHSQFIHLELNVENPGYREIPVRVKAMLLEVQAETEVTQTLPPGQSWVTLDLPLSGDLGSNQNLERLLTYRIHYRITPTADTGEDIATSGIFSVSLVARDVFRLRVLPQFRVTTWSEFCPKILAVHPISLTPVPHVQIKAEILSGTELISKSILITNQDGLVEPKFQFPAGFEKITEATLRISGKAGSTFTTRDFQIQIEQSPLILVTTDKLTYTAGEPLEINWFVARTDCTVVAGQKWQIE